MGLKMIFVVLLLFGALVIFGRMDQAERVGFMCFLRRSIVRVSSIIWGVVLGSLSWLESLVSLFYTRIFQALGQLPSDAEILDAQHEAWLCELIENARNAGATAMNLVVSNDEAVVMHIIEGKQILGIEASRGALSDLAVHIGCFAHLLNETNVHSEWLRNVDAIDLRVTRLGYDHLLTFSRSASS